MSCVLSSPGPHLAFSFPPASPLWSGVFLVSARSLSERGGLGALSRLAPGTAQRLWMPIVSGSSGDAGKMSRSSWARTNSPNLSTGRDETSSDDSVQEVPHE